MKVFSDSVLNLRVSQDLKHGKDTAFLVIFTQFQILVFLVFRNLVVMVFNGILNLKLLLLEILKKECLRILLIKSCLMFVSELVHVFSSILWEGKPISLFNLEDDFAVHVLEHVNSDLIVEVIALSSFFDNRELLCQSMLIDLLL